MGGRSDRADSMCEQSGKDCPVGPPTLIKRRVSYSQTNIKSMSENAKISFSLHLPLRATGGSAAISLISGSPEIASTLHNSLYILSSSLPSAVTCKVLLRRTGHAMTFMGEQSRLCGSLLGMIPIHGRGGQCGASLDSEAVRMRQIVEVRKALETNRLFP